jgi:hypothetical protein
MFTPCSEVVDKQLSHAGERLLCCGLCGEGVHSYHPGFIGGSICASNYMRYVFAAGAAGALVVLPFFPAFHEFADAPDFGNVFDHPALFSWL